MTVKARLYRWFWDTRLGGTICTLRGHRPAQHTRLYRDMLPWWDANGRTTHCVRCGEDGLVAVYVVG